MALWFECKVRYDKTHENGTVKKVNEPYLVDALSFTEAEARITEELRPYISGDFSIVAEKKTKISDIFFNSAGDRFYLVKVNYITINEKTGEDMKTENQILVQASGFEDALDVFKTSMKGTMADYEIASIAETLIMDVFPVNLNPDYGKTGKADG